MNIYGPYMFQWDTEVWSCFLQWIIKWIRWMAIEDSDHIGGCVGNKRESALAVGFFHLIETIISVCIPIPLPYGTFKKNDQNRIHQSQVKCHKVWFKDSAWKRRGCRGGSWVNNEDLKSIASGTSWGYAGNSFTASKNPEGIWSVYVISKTPVL